MRSVLENRKEREEHLRVSMSFTVNAARLDMFSRRGRNSFLESLHAIRRRAHRLELLSVGKEFSWKKVISLCFIKSAFQLLFIVYFSFFCNLLYYYDYF